MLRLTELRLPLDHPPEAIWSSIRKRFSLDDDALSSVSVVKRSFDARKKHAVLLIYAIDFEVADEAALLAKYSADRQLMPKPDTNYHQVAHAPESLASRPLIVGFGPCGIFAALVLAQMGFRPIVLELSLIHISEPTRRS